MGIELAEGEVDPLTGTDNPLGTELSADDLTPEELDVLDYYTGGGWREINPALNAAKFGTPLPDDIAERVRLLDQAIAKARPLPGDTFVYRGISMSPSGPSVGLSETELIGNLTAKAQDLYPVGSIIDMHGRYASTSTTLAPAMDAAGSANSPGIFFKIRAKTGAALNKVSRYDDEFEVLLPRDSQFEVLSIRQTPIQSLEDWLEGDDPVIRTVVELIQK